ncbi:MAG: dTMP kinase [Proteobacteria bacterium]|nr:MAG: dTMP kinase [Pseudomonadota bacterium]
MVFEGLDGSGKSTLIQGLTKQLESSGQKFRLTREPGGTPLAEDIRNLLLRTESEAPVATTELLLYAASRAQHVAGVIQPSLRKGEWVICDRFSASSVAFQCFARGLDRSQIDWLNTFAQAGTSPDLYVLVDVTVDESERRQSKRIEGGQKADRMESEKREFHENVRRGYLAQAKENPKGWLVLDGTLSPEDLRNELIAKLKERGWLK